MKKYNSAFYALFIKDYRIQNCLTLDDVSKRLANHGVLCKKERLSRMENKQLRISDEFFEAFCLALEIPYHICQEEQREEIAQLYALLSNHLEHRRITQEEIYQKVLSLDAAFFLTSDLRFPFRVLISVLPKPNLYDQTFENMTTDLMKIGSLNLKDEYPSVDPDYFALAAYYYGLYLIRQNEVNEARKALEFCSSTCTGNIIPLLASFSDYQKLRCHETWKNPKEAIALCQKTAFTMNQSQCFHRVWNLEMLRAAYMIRDGQIASARKLILNCAQEAQCLSADGGKSSVLQSLIWLEAIAGEYEQCLSYVDQYRQLKPEEAVWDMDFYDAYCFYKLGRISDAKEVLNKNVHREEYDFEDQMLALLKLRIARSKVFPQKAVSGIQQFSEQNVPEAISWTLDLLRDFYSEANDTLNLLLISDIALEYARSRTLSDRLYTIIEPA